MCTEKRAVANERFVAQGEWECACSSGSVICRRKRDISGKSYVINCCVILTLRLLAGIWLFQSQRKRENLTRTLWIWEPSPCSFMLWIYQNKLPLCYFKNTLKCLRMKAIICNTRSMAHLWLAQNMKYNYFFLRTVDVFPSLSALPKFCIPCLILKY